MHTALVIGAGVVLIAAIIVFVYLPARAGDARESVEGAADGFASLTYARAEGALELDGRASCSRLRPLTNPPPRHLFDPDAKRSQGTAIDRGHLSGPASTRATAVGGQAAWDQRGPAVIGALGFTRDTVNPLHSPAFRSASSTREPGQKSGRLVAAAWLRWRPRVEQMSRAAGVIGCSA